MKFKIRRQGFNKKGKEPNRERFIRQNLMVIVFCAVSLIAGIFIGAMAYYVINPPAKLNIVNLQLQGLKVSDVKYSGDSNNFTMTITITATEDVPNFLKVSGFLLPKGGAISEFIDLDVVKMLATPVTLAKGGNVTITDYTETGIALGHTFPFYLLLEIDGSVTQFRQLMYVSLPREIGGYV